MERFDPLLNVMSLQILHVFLKLYAKEVKDEYGAGSRSI